MSWNNEGGKWGAAQGRGRGKQKPKNNYVFFMEDFRAKQEKAGITYANKEEVAKAASSSWQSMTPDQKEVYNKKAAAWKISNGKIVGEKYTSTGLSVSQIENAQMEIQQAKEREEFTLNNFISEAVANNTLAEKVFIIMDTNYLCRPIDGSVVTCEFALCAFSLAKGVTHTAHNMVEDPTPVGYAYNATDQAKRIGLTLPIQGTRANYPYLLATLIGFLQEFKDSVKEKNIPVLFTMPESMETVNGCLDKMCATNDYETNFKLYSLDGLLFKLRNAVAKDGDIGFPTIALAQEQFAHDTYTYAHGLSCDWHRESDLYPACSLSRIQRLSFTILRHCCKHLEIQLVPGTHLPASASSLASLTAPSTYGQCSMKSDSISQTAESSRWSVSSVTSDTATASSSTDSRFPSTSKSRQDFPALRPPTNYASATKAPVKPDKTDSDGFITITKRKSGRKH